MDSGSLHVVNVTVADPRVVPDTPASNATFQTLVLSPAVTDGPRPLAGTRCVTSLTCVITMTLSGFPPAALLNVSIFLQRSDVTATDDGTSGAKLPCDMLFCFHVLVLVRSGSGCHSRGGSIVFAVVPVCLLSRRVAPPCRSASVRCCSGSTGDGFIAWDRHSHVRVERACCSA